MKKLKGSKQSVITLKLSEINHILSCIYMK